MQEENAYGFMGLGHFVRDEESTPHPDVRLVVFHHRGRFPAPGGEPMAVGAAGGISAGATGCGCGVSPVWVDVVGIGVNRSRKSVQKTVAASAPSRSRLIGDSEP
jgi:hypothetical protein